MKILTDKKLKEMRQTLAESEDVEKPNVENVSTPIPK